MACPDVINQLCDELGEDINSELCQELKDHLEHCEDCRSCFESIKNTVKAYQNQPEQPVPADVTERIFKMLDC